MNLRIKIGRYLSGTWHNRIRWRRKQQYTQY